MFDELQEGVHKIAAWYRTEAKNPEVDPHLIVQAQQKITSYIATIGAQEITAKREATHTKLDYEFQHYTCVSRVKQELQCSNAEADRVSELETFKLKEKHKIAEDNHHAWKSLYMYSKILWEQLRSHLSYLKNQMGNE